MNLLEQSLRAVDPVDPDAPVPDGEALLRELIGAPVPPRRVRRLRPRVALAAAVAAGTAGLVLALPGSDDVDVVAAAFEAVSRPGTILHYRVEHSTTWPGPAASREPSYTVEVWQAGDGSRLRSLSRTGAMPKPHVSETVHSDREWRTWQSVDNRIVVYDTNVPRLPGPGGTALLGDPRTLLERARSGNEKVVELGEATVRGIPVLRFRVGECRMTVRKSGGGVAISYRLPVVASVARDDYTPVRIEQSTECAGARRPEGGPPWHDAPRQVADYVAFETLEATAANRRLLEMRPHPGARVVDGEDVDAAEEG